jgi:hypothetical protein
MFFEKGFPIGLFIDTSNKCGYEVSILHVAKECLENGWSPETVIKKFREDFRDSIDHRNYDFTQLEKFCFSKYEYQQEMIFKYLYGLSWDEAKNYPNIDVEVKRDLELTVAKTLLS